MATRTLYDNLGDKAQYAPGTGTFTLTGAAPPPLISIVRIASSVIVDGASVGYLAVDPSNQALYEVGTGTFTLSTKVLTRSPQFGSLANFLGNVNIYIVALAEDFAAIAATQYVDASDDLTMQSNYTYRADDPDDRVLFSLPVSGGTFGDAPITILGYNLGGWKIIQRMGEQITINGSVNATTTGTSGFLESNNINDKVTLYPMGGGIYAADVFGCSFQ